MPSEPSPPLPNRQLLLSALQTSHLRLDSRPLDTLRPISISFGSDDEHSSSTPAGFADVRLGETRVMCHTSAKLAKPYEDRKFDGVLAIQVEVGNMAGAHIEMGRPSPLSDLLTPHIDHLLRRSGALSTESLCLLAGHTVWHLTLTLQILSHDGSLATAASIAAICSLESLRVQDTEVRGGEVRVFEEGERDLVGLGGGGGGGGMMFWPVSVGFAGFQAGMMMMPTVERRNGGSAADADADVDEDAEADKMDYEATGSSNTTTPNHTRSDFDRRNTIILLDPTRMEEQCSSSSLIISATKDGEIIQMSKPGGEAIDAVTLLRCSEVAVKKVKEVHEIIGRALERDKERRGEGKGVERELRSENER